MKIDLKDTAITFRIHVGILRDGSLFLESEAVENVLGDVPHKMCVEAIVAAVVATCDKAISFHEGHEGIKEVKQEVDDLSFFDREVDIDD